MKDLRDLLDTWVWAIGEWWSALRGNFGGFTQTLAALIGIASLAVAAIAVYGIGRELA